MVSILLYIAILIAVLQIFWSLKVEGGIYQYPFLGSCVFLFFIIAQLYSVWQTNRYEEYAIIRVLLMSIGCQTAGFLGYLWTRSSTNQSVNTCDLKYLRYFAIGSVVFGAFFQYKLFTMPEELISSSGFSGRNVAYLFLSKPLLFGGAIALAISLRQRDILMRYLAVAVLSFLLFGIVMGGRRGTMLELGIVVLTIIFFYNRWSVPKYLVLAAVPLGAIFVNGIATYRSAVSESDEPGNPPSLIQSPIQISKAVFAVLENANESLIPENAVEIENAIAYMDDISKGEAYDLGTGLWDFIVHRLVPAQVLGAGFKANLKFNFMETTLQSSHHRRVFGSTFTGLTDAFQGFGYLGAIYFFLNGVILRVFWNSAMNGSFTCQIGYGVLARDGLESITHNSGYLVVGVIIVWAFLIVPIGLIRRYSTKSATSFQLNGTFQRQPTVVNQEYLQARPMRIENSFSKSRLPKKS